MIVDRIAVTDHIQNFSIEREILGDLFDNEITEKRPSYLYGIKS